MIFKNNSLIRPYYWILVIITFAYACSDDSEDPATISIEDLNITIPENPTNGQILGVLNATSNGTITFAIIESDPEGAFSLNQTTGELSVADSSIFDFETNPVLTATISASNGSISDEAQITVNLNNIEEEVPPTISIEDFSSTIAENPTDGQVLGTLTATSNGTITFSIVDSNPEGAFSLDQATGELSVADTSLFDFEVNPTLTAVVTGTNGSAVDSANVIVTLTDLNENTNTRQLSEVLFQSSDNLRPDNTFRFVYDDLDRISSIFCELEFDDSDELDVFEFRVSYNSNNPNQISDLQIFDNGIEDDSADPLFIYDDNDNLLRIEFIEEVGESFDVDIIEFTYNSGGILTIYEELSGEGETEEEARNNIEPGFSESSTGFEGNNVASIFTSDGGFDEEDRTYSYDTNPNPFRNEVLFVIGEFVVTDQLTSFVSENNVTEIVSSTNTRSFAYEYDDEGYPISVVVTNLGFSSTETVTFTYRE